MFGIGNMELIIVGVIALLLFGNRLPSVMRSLGSGISEFKKGLDDVNTEFKKGLAEGDKPAQPEITSETPAESTSEPVAEHKG